MVKTAITKRVDIKSSILKQARFGIVRATFNQGLTGNLEEFCIKTLRENRVPKKQIDIYRVPGSLEIPVMAKKLAQSDKYDVLIALGAIIKGDTYHFELVANECSRGCMNVALEYSIPVIFEVLAAYNRKQAEERCGRDEYNKGIEAAVAALEMLKVINSLGKND